MVALSPVDATPRSEAPRIRRISTADLRWALRQGWEDYKEKRGDVLILGFLYPAVGVLASAMAANRSLVPLVFPLIAGLSILGPAVASGFYELARRREQKLDTSWRHFFEPFLGRSQGSILALSLMLAVLFSLWIGVAWGLYQLMLGAAGPTAPAAFLRDLFTTREGLTLVVAGNLAGLVFAAAVLALSLVSFPMVVDRPINPMLAVSTSLQACAKNPRTVAIWGLTVAVLLVIGSIPLFIGLAVVLPVLGYATWRLYTRLVERG